MRARNMQALTDSTARRHPGVVIYGKGDAAHALRYSDHNEDDTPGSLAAQSDADTVPEHRAIDIMLGSAFTATQARQFVDGLLGDPAALRRLKYIIFDGSIWSRSNGWARADYTGDDQHTDHVHVSGDAADDENAATWPAVDKGGITMFLAECKVGDSGPHVKFLQYSLWDIHEARKAAGEPSLWPLSGGYPQIPATFDTKTGQAMKRLLAGGDGVNFTPLLAKRLVRALAALEADAPVVADPAPAGTTPEQVDAIVRALVGRAQLTIPTAQ